MNEILYQIFEKTGNIEAYLYCKSCESLHNKSEGDHGVNEVESFKSEQKSKVL